jgi:regulator of RNase E activity RraA
LGPRPRPRRDDALSRANVGEWRVSRDDLVFADDDGVLFVPADRIDEIFSLAQFIRDTEPSGGPDTVGNKTARTAAL